MFENIDELIDVNLKLLYTSKTKFMMRINFKDEYGFNLKNSKVFAETLVNKGLVSMDCPKGFQCNLTDLGKQIYENGGWIKYLNTVDPFAENHSEQTQIANIKTTEKLFSNKVLIASFFVLIVCVFITLLSVGIFKK